MDTVTRTFPISLNSSYTANSIIELCHFRDMNFDADERVGVYLESFFCNLNLKNFNLGVIPDFDGDESEAEKMAKFNATEAKSQKVGLRILYPKKNIGDWIERAEIILVNRGRKDYFDLLQPYLAKNQVSVLEVNDALAVQLIDYGNGLLKQDDSLFILAAITISISKKNDIEALQARISVLELALEGKLTNLPSNSLLGRNTNTGVVEAISQTKFATPTMIDQAITDLVGGAPGALNTLIELASALNNDANFAATVTSNLATKVNLSGNQTINGNITFNGTVLFNNFITTTSNLGATNTGSAGFQAGTDIVGNICLSLFGGQNKKTCYLDFAVNYVDFDARFIANTTELTVQTASEYYFNLGVRLKASLPTSPTGLPSGAIWRNGNALNIV